MMSSAPAGRIGAFRAIRCLGNSDMMPNQRVGAYLADVGMRVKLAASPCTPGEVLAYLARDQAVTVRAAAALNPSLTKAADLQLAEDADERVRMLLARKVAGALPGLSTSDEADLRDRTLATLSALVRDEAVRVRTLLAVVMADLPDIPKDLVLTLAQDNSVSVSDPVLRLSPPPVSSGFTGTLGNTAARIHRDRHSLSRGFACSRLRCNRRIRR